jgi:outer membrane protein assembly factor BamA
MIDFCVRMSKLRLYVCTTLFLLFAGGISGFSQYRLVVDGLNADSLLSPASFGIESSFRDRTSCIEYVYKLPSMLAQKGFVAASVDSMRFDSAGAWIQLYMGDRFSWGSVKTSKEDAGILAASGWNIRKIKGKSFQPEEVKAQQLKILDYLENNGYPFARISLDSVTMDRGSVNAKLKIEKGPLYKIDSIRIYGNAKISVSFLQHYLGIADGSIYRKDKLLAISRKILELPYLTEERPWTLTMLGAGSILNLYLKPKKSSQVDVLVGFLPNNDQLTSGKLLVTGQATVNLKNSFGNGESIGLNWQQLQQKSPRLNLGYQQPYLFNSSFGVNASFSLYKKDSSFLTTDGLLGAQYASSANRTGMVFIESSGSHLLTVDTLSVIATHSLPAIADVSSVSLGLFYEIYTTNYRFNPLRGNELQLTGSVGTKKIKKNEQILKLTDPGDSAFSFNNLYDTIKLSSYQFRVNLVAAHYFQVSRASTVKLGLNAGVYQSVSTFRNDLFQIGGYKLLRGFDEESILASQYAVGTLEFRYLIAQNSFLFSFLDGGWAKNTVPQYAQNSIYLGLGLGLAFETKAGIFNISYAVGKQGSNPFELRQAKIHLGYLNFF